MSIEEVLGLTGGKLEFDERQQMWRLTLGSAVFTYPTIDECRRQALAFAVMRLVGKS